MNRKDFLKSIGFSTGAIMATYCMGGLSGCQQDPITPSPINDMKLDLTDSNYAALLSVGGWLRTNNVVIAHVSQDEYVAVTQICSHEGQRNVGYRPASNDFYCTSHGAQFTIEGKGKNSNGSRGLTVYQTHLDGNFLNIIN